MADINPLRYRGYYYDTETGFYYLQSRYYDPVTHRFINADGYASTDSTDAIACNMFAYCGNNPVVRTDPNGDFFFTIIGAAVGAVCGAIDAAIYGEDILAGAAGGAVSGAIAGATADAIAITGGSALFVAGAMALAGAAGACAEDVTKTVITGDKKYMKEMGRDMLYGAAFGGLFGYMGGPATSKIGKVSEKGLITVLKDTLKVGAKKWGTNIAEEALANTTQWLGKFTGKILKKMIEKAF